jgi:hypothetical protein
MVVIEGKSLQDVDVRLAPSPEFGQSIIRSGDHRREEVQEGLPDQVGRTAIGNPTHQPRSVGMKVYPRFSRDATAPSPPGVSDLASGLMDQLRAYEPDGRVVATSSDGVNFTDVADGNPFARRMGDVFHMADDSLGTLIGSVVFTQGSGGTQNPTFWLEHDEGRVASSGRE